MANSEPMSEARLAEIRARAYTMYPLSSYPLEPNLVEWMGVASDDRCSLLAEVERLRAREIGRVIVHNESRYSLDDVNRLMEAFAKGWPESMRLLREQRERER